MAQQVEEIRYTVTADTTDVEEKLTKVGDSAAATGEAAGGLTKQLDTLTGGLASGFVAGAVALKRFGGGMKGVNAVLKASPLFLLVGLLASVVTAFRSSEEGAEKFNRIMGVLGSVFDNVLDLVAQVKKAATREEGRSLLLKSGLLEEVIPGDVWAFPVFKKQFCELLRNP